ncbi:hypothetical protein QFZ56_006885 [Streptomyces achromogenes]|uniref:Uncharacterized protein n=1 Tax=Streptomyces achromogenes TaxID=67255 RepID=A0ABU0QB79_STRAH|nr:hypothetical protein [Streptomyces achromogenes]
MDLQRVHDQAQLLHLRTAGGTGLPGELLPVADHVLDRQPAHDGPQMTGEDVVHPLRHQLLLVEETPGRVGDRHEVVAHLEDDHAPHPERNALVRHAVHLQFGLVQVERQLAHHLHAGHHQRAAPGDDAETHARLETLGAVVGAGDDECLVGLRDAPHHLEQTDQREDGDNRHPRNDADNHRHTPPCDGALSAPNEGSVRLAGPRLKALTHPCCNLDAYVPEAVRKRPSPGPRRAQLSYARVT